MIKQIAWALRDKSGVPAQYFSQIADIGWLPIIEREGLLDISVLKDENLFSDRDCTDLSSIHTSLVNWLVRHLDSPVVIELVAAKGGHLHHQLASKIERTLDDQPTDKPLPLGYKQFWQICLLNSARQNPNYQLWDGFQLSKDITGGTGYWQWLFAHRDRVAETQLLCRQLMSDAGKLVKFDEGLCLDLIESLIMPVCQWGIKNDTEDSDEDSYHQAINHPAGELISALMNALWHKPRAVGSGMPPRYGDLLQQIIGSAKNTTLTAAVSLLGSRAGDFFQLDPTWTNTTILPLFNWQKQLGYAAWEGFLSLLRINPTFIQSLKPFIIEATELQNLNQIAKKLSSRIYTLLFIVGWHFPEVMKHDETYALLQKASDEGKIAFIDACVQLQETATETDELWAGQLKPFIEKVWPKDEAVQTSGTSASFTKLLSQLTHLSLNEWHEIEHLFVPQIEEMDLGQSVNDLKCSTLHTNSPDAVVCLTERIFSADAPHRDRQQLQQLLSSIVKDNPAIADMACFKRIKDKLEAAGLPLP